MIRLKDILQLTFMYKNMKNNILYSVGAKLKQGVFVKHNAPDILTKAKIFDTSRKILSQEMTMYMP